jgi:hypothetical protein
MDHSPAIVEKVLYLLNHAQLKRPAGGASVEQRCLPGSFSV